LSPYGLGKAVGIRLYGAYAVVATEAGLEVLTLPGLDPAGRLPLPGLPSALDLDGEVAYVATQAAGVHAVSLATPTAPKLLGTTPLRESVSRIGADAGLVVAGLEAGGVAVLDARAHHPARDVARFEVTGQLRNLEVIGSRANLAAEHGGLRFLDLTQPEAPFESGAMTWPGPGGDALDVAHLGDRVVVSLGCLGCTREVRVVDAADPSSPTEVGSLGGLGESYPSHDHLAADGQYVYAVRDQLHVIAPAGPLGPTELSTMPLAVKYPNDADAHDGLLAVASEDQVELIDVSDPAAPKSVATRGFYAGGAVDVAVAGQRALVARPDGVAVVDLSDPAAPAELAWLPEINVRAVAWDGSLACVVGLPKKWSYSPSGDLATYDLTDPAKPVALGTLHLDQEPAHLALLGDVVLVGGSKLQAVDLAIPEAPALVWETPGYVNAISVRGTRGLVATTSQELVLFDTTNPRVYEPLATATLGPGYLSSGLLMEREAWGLTGSRVIERFDVSQGGLEWAGTIELPSPVERLVEEGGLVFALGLTTWVFDVRSGPGPTLVGSFQPPGGATRLAFDGPHALVTSPAAQLSLLDIACVPGAPLPPTLPAPVDLPAALRVIDVWQGANAVEIQSEGSTLVGEIGYSHATAWLDYPGRAPLLILPAGGSQGAAVEVGLPASESRRETLVVYGAEDTPIGRFLPPPLAAADAQLATVRAVHAGPADWQLSVALLTLGQVTDLGDLAAGESGTPRAVDPASLPDLIVAGPGFDAVLPLPQLAAGIQYEVVIAPPTQHAAVIAPAAGEARFFVLLAGSDGSVGRLGPGTYRASLKVIQLTSRAGALSLAVDGIVPDAFAGLPLFASNREDFMAPGRRYLEARTPEGAVVATRTVDLAVGDDRVATVHDAVDGGVEILLRRAEPTVAWDNPYTFVHTRPDWGAVDIWTAPEDSFDSKPEKLVSGLVPGGTAEATLPATEFGYLAIDLDRDGAVDTHHRWFQYGRSYAMYLASGAHGESVLVSDDGGAGVGATYAEESIARLRFLNLSGNLARFSSDGISSIDTGDDGMVELLDEQATYHYGVGAGPRQIAMPEMAEEIPLDLAAGSRGTLVFLPSQAWAYIAEAGAPPMPGLRFVHLAPEQGVVSATWQPTDGAPVSAGAELSYGDLGPLVPGSGSGTLALNGLTFAVPSMTQQETNLLILRGPPTWPELIVVDLTGVEKVKPPELTTELQVIWAAGDMGSAAVTLDDGPLLGQLQSGVGAGAWGTDSPLGVLGPVEVPSGQHTLALAVKGGPTLQVAGSFEGQSRVTIIVRESGGDFATLRFDVPQGGGATAPMRVLHASPDLPVLGLYTLASGNQATFVAQVEPEAFLELAPPAGQIDAFAVDVDGDGVPDWKTAGAWVPSDLYLFGTPDEVHIVQVHQPSGGALDAILPVE
jgi:hypothetical protein